MEEACAAGHEPDPPQGWLPVGALRRFNLTVLSCRCGFGSSATRALCLSMQVFGFN